MLALVCVIIRVTWDKRFHCHVIQATEAGVVFSIENVEVGYLSKDIQQLLPISDTFYPQSVSRARFCNQTHSGIWNHCEDRLFARYFFNWIFSIFINIKRYITGMRDVVDSDA